MTIYVVYFLIIILANCVGSISGMGGGVIIKPLLDLIGYHSLTEITFYSSIAVFTMSVSSTYKQLKNGVVVNWSRAIIISDGSVIGGILGSKLFVYLLNQFNDDRKVQLLQIILTIISLLLVLFYTLWSKKTFKFNSYFLYLVVGLLLGGFSTLLGIGGGPINVSLLMFCFSLSMKEATVYSIITIFFSQLAKLFEVGTTTGFAKYDLSILLIIIPAALLGGYIGGVLGGRFSDKVVSKIFVCIILIVIVINLYNALNTFY